MGMLERDGEFRAQIIPDTSAKTLYPIIGQNVQRGATVITDDMPAYKGLDGWYDHTAIAHNRGEWAKGSAHTNSLEGAWALLKRQIIGIHHWISTKHLARYVAEATWRYNLRHLAEDERMVEFLGRTSGRLTYKGLIGKA